MSAAPAVSVIVPLRRAAGLWTSARAQLGVALAVYVVTTLAVTWPMPVHPSTTIYGKPGDAFVYISELREVIQDHASPFWAGTVHDFSAPEGLEIRYPLYLASWGAVLPRYALAAALGPLAGYDVFVLLGYVLSGAAMFLLARRLSGSALAGGLAGWAFAFYPLALAKGQVHVDFTHGWVLILLVWRLLELRTAPTLRNGLLAGAASLFAVSFNPYFILLAFVIQATLAVADLLLARRERLLRPHLTAQLAAAIPPLAVLTLYAVVDATAAQSTIRDRPIADAYRFGARLLEYVVPPPGHWLFGRVTAGWWSTHLHGSNTYEASLYVGVTVLLLAAVALRLARKGRLSPERVRSVQLLTAVGVAALVFSFPPSLDLGGVSIYTPAWLIYQLASTWRAFERFGIVVVLALTLLAAIGLAELARSLRPRVAAAVAAAAVLLVPLDLWARPPGPPTFTIPHYWVYATLAAEPPGIVAEYPLRPYEETPYDGELYQQQHGHPLVNYYAGGSREEARALWLARLDDPRTGSRLALLGVRDVVLNPAAPDPRLPQPGLPRRGFSEIARSDGRTLYRVTARPAASLVWPAQGYSLPEGGPGSQLAWLVHSRGELDVIARCSRCTGRLHFTAWSFAEPRTLWLSVAGQTVFAGRIDTAPRAFSVPISFSRRARIAVETSPGPRSARKATGGADPRSLAVAFVEPDFVPQ